MIRAWCFRASEPRKEVAIDAIAAHAADRHCLLWVDAGDPTPEEVAQLAGPLGIHELTAEDLLNANQRTKLERYGDHYHIALRDCVLVEGHLAAREVDVVFAEGWLLSVRHRADGVPPEEIDDAVQRFERQRSEHDSNDEGFLLWAMLDVIVDRYFSVTERIDERLDDIEDLVFDQTPEAIPREIFALRRALVTFRRAVGPLREVISELLRKEVECISEPALTHMQDVYDHVLRVLDLVESQRELLTGLLEGQLAIQSNQMNRVMKATSSWGAILIVGTLIAGIYGMNFRHMPELSWAVRLPLRARLDGARDVRAVPRVQASRLAVVPRARPELRRATRGVRSDRG